MKRDEDMIFIAYKKSEIFAYAYDRDLFFHYLQNFYSLNLEVELYIEKTTDPKKTEQFQSLYPEKEITIFFPDVYLTVAECRYWDAYFREFYDNTREILIREKKNNPNVVIINSYESLMLYMGKKKIQNIINAANGAPRDDRLYQEYLRKIEDK